MFPKVKEDIISVLNKAIPALKKEDFDELLDLSNRTIHNASIFQDQDSIAMAVLMYSLAKLCQNCKEKNIKIPNFSVYLEKALNFLKKNNIKLYEDTIKEIFKFIKRIDKEAKIYVEEAINRAKIKKASWMHAHGISIPRTAELLGISQWDLRNYIGVTKVPDKSLGGLTAIKRLDVARRLFK